MESISGLSRNNGRMSDAKLVGTLQNSRTSGVVIDRGKLDLKFVRVREVNAVGPARAPWLQSLPVKLVHHCLRFEILNCNAEVIQSRLLVFEQRQKVLAQSQEAVRFFLMENRHSEMLLVEISRPLHVRYAYGDVIQGYSFERGPSTASSFRCRG